jgi:hypothetical protein
MTEEGTELLLLGSNGSRLSHVVQGIDLDAALSLTGEPNWQQGVGDNLGEILKAQPPPYVPEPEPEPEPEPVKPKERRTARAPEPPADPLLDASARSIAKRVWAWPGDRCGRRRSGRVAR